jgi:hypothetical protein
MPDQIYTSQPKSGSATDFEWVLKETQAKLYASSGEKIGIHSGVGTID